MPFQIVEAKIEAVSCDAKVEPFLDRSGAAGAQFYPLRGAGQYDEYDRLETISISEYALTPARQRNCRYVIRTPVPCDAAALNDPDIVRHCYQCALQIVHDLGLKTVAFPLIGSADGEHSKEQAQLQVFNASRYKNGKLTLYLSAHTKEGSAELEILNAGKTETITLSEKNKICLVSLREGDTVLTSHGGDIIISSYRTD